MGPGIEAGLLLGGVSWSLFVCVCACEYETCICGSTCDLCVWEAGYGGLLCLGHLCVDGVYVFVGACTYWLG